MDKSIDVGSIVQIKDGSELDGICGKVISVFTPPVGRWKLLQIELDVGITINKLNSLVTAVSNAITA